MEVMIGLTRSQQMALQHILAEYLRAADGHPQEFVDCSNQKVTTTAELLTVVGGNSDVNPERVVSVPLTRWEREIIAAGMQEGIEQARMEQASEENRMVMVSFERLRYKMVEAGL